MESRERGHQNFEHVDYAAHVERVLRSASQVRPDENDFGELYNETIISRDLEVVKILEGKFDENIDHLTPSEIKRVKEGRKRSEALEVIIVEGAELHNWFGPNVFASRTGKYDDYSGIDEVLEIVQEEGEQAHSVALAIDASMRPDFSSIQRKIKRNVEKVLGPKKPRVKYFQSAVDGSKKSLTMVLPVVVGVEGKNAEELINLFGEVIQLREIKDKTEQIKKKLKERLEIIANHPAQVVFLQEIISLMVI